MKIWSGTLNYNGTGNQVIIPLFDPLRLDVQLVQDISNLNVFHGTVNKDVLNSSEADRTYSFANGTCYQVTITSVNTFEISCFDLAGYPLADVFHPGPLDLFAY